MNIRLYLYTYMAIQSIVRKGGRSFVEQFVRFTEAPLKNLVSNSDVSDGLHLSGIHTPMVIDGDGSTTSSSSSSPLLSSYFVPSCRVMLLK